MKKTIITAALVLAGAALAGTSASAQSFPVGDLLLNFRLTTGGQDLEVDLGSAASFTSNESAVSGLVDADLVQAYGPSWDTNTSLVYSIAGTTASGTTVFIDDPANSTKLTASSPGAASLSPVLGSLYEENSGTASTNPGSAGSFVTPSASDSFSYLDVLLNVNNDHGPTPYSSDYGVLSYNSEQAVTINGTAMDTSVDVYEQVPGKGGSHPVAASSTDLGTFTLEDNGTLEFATVAAPEPSSYALLGLGAAALLFMRRRSMKA